MSRLLISLLAFDTTLGTCKRSHLHRHAVAFILMTCLSCSFSALSYGQAMDLEVEKLATDLAAKLVAKKCPKIAALDFTNLQGKSCELGSFLALALSGDMVNASGITVVDRANLATIMKEHELTAEGLLNPAEAKKLGQFAGVGALLFGTLTASGDEVVLFVRAISTETAEVLAAGKAKFKSTKDINTMLERKVDGQRATVSAPSSSSATGASATEGDAIATKEVGPLTITLRNVMESSIQQDRTLLPAIRLTFDLENRNLQRSVAVAANQRVREDTGSSVDIDGYRGDLADSNTMLWKLIEVKGISAVACFDVTGASAFIEVQQGNPGGVVDYIRTAKHFDGLSIKYNDRARSWCGSLGSIAPGGKIRLTVDFVPVNYQDPRTHSSSDTEPWTSPEYFQFDMELVTGTFIEGEEPHKAKDLALQTLTLDKVVLPKKAPK